MTNVKLLYLGIRTTAALGKLHVFENLIGLIPVHVVYITGY